MGQPKPRRPQGQRTARRGKRPPQGRRPRQITQKEGERPRRRKKQQFLDVHVRVGLDDEITRMTVANFQIFLMKWVLGGEDIVLRAARDSYESNIVLRGTEGGSYSVRAANPAQKVPRYDVVSTEDLRREQVQKVLNPAA